MATLGNIIIAELIVLIFIGGSGACDTDSMLGCMAGFSKYQNSSTAVFVEYTEARLQDACRLFSKADTCMEQALVGCQSQALPLWSGLQDYWQYICSKEGRAGYLNHADCWGKANLKRQGKDCTSTYQSSINDMISSYRNGGYSNNFQEYYADICRATNLYLKCVYGSVESTCGVEAADWQFKLTETIVRPSLSFIQCKLDTLSSKTNRAGGRAANRAGTLTAGGALLWILASLLVYMRSFPLE